jgi:hypothetical protein
VEPVSSQGGGSGGLGDWALRVILFGVAIAVFAVAIWGLFALRRLSTR